MTLDTLKPTLLPTMSVRGLFVLRWLLMMLALLQPFDMWRFCSPSSSRSCAVWR